jgi:hypothetical protein
MQIRHDCGRHPTQSREAVCQNKTSDPLENPCKLLAPFAMAVDQQNRIWISLASDTVTRIEGSDPSKVENFK